MARALPDAARAQSGLVSRVASRCVVDVRSLPFGRLVPNADVCDRRRFGGRRRWLRLAGGTPFVDLQRGDGTRVGGRAGCRAGDTYK